MFYIQLIGVLAFAVLVLSFYKKKPSTIIAYQIVSNFAYTVHYFLLGALSGAYISFIGIFRNIAIIKVEKYKKTLVGIVILLYLIVTLIFYEGVHSLFPLVANSAYLITMVIGTKKSLLIGGIISPVLWASYGLFVGSYASTITETILLVSNTMQLIKLLKQNQN
jgi:hypothetical protein